MESLFVGSFAKSPSSFSFPVTAKLSSGKNVSVVQVFKGKAWKNPGKLFTMPMVLQNQYHFRRHAGGNNEGFASFYWRGKNNFRLKAASEQPFESEPSKKLQNSLQDGLDAFYRFSRPHTVIGTALSIMSVSLLAVEKVSDISPLFFTGMFQAIVAALFMNVYIVGLNQLSDIEIDKVNKPYLPLASGEYSVKTGVMIVSSFAIISFWLGWIVGSWPLFWALFISFVLGTAYSINLPMLRWKRFAFIAALCILAVRAVIVQIAFYLHMQTYVYARPAAFTKPVIFATAFMSFFSVVIALFKDIPDIVGDKIFGIRSFTVRLGQERVFWICISLLEMAYLVAILVGATSPFIWSKSITIAGHIMLASLLWARAKSIDLQSKTAITSFYMFIWKVLTSFFICFLGGLFFEHTKIMRKLY